MRYALPISRRLLVHAADLALSQARASVGNKIPSSTAMMPITTSSSTSVNARNLRIVVLRVSSRALAANTFDRHRRLREHYLLLRADDLLNLFLLRAGVLQEMPR